MKVFMLGWEFPPFISGGLGTACYGLTRALDQLGTEVIFVLPAPVPSEYAGRVRLLGAGGGFSRPVARYAKLGELKHVSFRTIGSLLTPYTTPAAYQHQQQKTEEQKRKAAGHSAPGDSAVLKQALHYAGDMFQEVHRFAAAAVRLAVDEEFDVVHAHDWMTYPAGIAVAKASGKGLIVHVHSTEFDRSGEHVNQMIYDIERRGMHAADRVIAVSHWTRNIIISRYSVPGEKVEVIYNGVEHNGQQELWFDETGITKDEKIVLFLGRVTMQKGPDYFMAAAKKVLEVMDNVKFVVAGAGDMLHRTIELAAQLGIGHKVLFTGFLRGDDVSKVFKMADLYVMPSVSEPFGIAPLEALDRDVPALISKQSGVSEVLRHVLKVDFWDVNEMANKIVAVLRYGPLRMTLREQGNFEVRKFRWQDTAEACKKVYEQTMTLV